jgi:hypothetical protein
MERRVVAPPPPPSIVWPRSTSRPEHVPTHDASSNICDTARHKVVIDAPFAAFAPSHLVKRSGGEDPLVQRDATDAERVGELLIPTRAVAIDRNCEAVDPQSTHEKISD